MDHGAVDHEIHKLLKQATQQHKDGNTDVAIETIQKALIIIPNSSLVYPASTFTKIIPYFQKAGRYSEAEPFCINTIIPLINKTINIGFQGKPLATLEASFNQMLSQVCDKLALVARREGIEEDRKKFIKAKSDYHNQYLAKFEQSKIELLEQDLKEVIEVFGEDSTKWPPSYRRQFNL